MDEINREMFLMHSETPEYLNAIDECNSIIDSSLNRYSKPFLSISGGKDSLVMLHLVISMQPEIVVYHWDYGKYYIPELIENEIINMMDALDVKNRIIKSSDKYNQHGRSDQQILFKELYGHVLPEFKRQGYDLNFVGLRSAESCKRNRKINKNPIYKQNIIDECYPLMNLSWKDVWAYIISNELPYLSHYDLYGPLVGYDLVRMSTYFDPEFDKLGASNIDGVLMPYFRNR